MRNIMSTIRPRQGLGAALALLLPFCPAARVAMGQSPAKTGNGIPDVQIWIEDPLVKLRPNSLPPDESAAEVSLEAARGEMVAGQIALRSSREIEKLSVTATPALFGGKIPAKANFVGYVMVGASELPDPLLPDREISLAPNKTQAVWVRLYPPADAAPGKYSGSITLEAGGERAVVPVNLELYPALLPPGRTLKYFHLQNITCQFHQIPKRLGNEYQAEYRSPVFDAPLGFEGWKEEHWSLVRDFIRHQVAHRQNAFSVGFWDVIKIIGKGEGEYDFDFTWLDMYVDLILKEEPNAWFMGTWYGWPNVRREVEDDWGWQQRSKDGFDLGTFWPTWVYKRYSYDGKAGIDAELDRAIPAFTWVLDPRIKEITDQMLPALQAFLERKGLAGRYYLCLHDEVFPTGAKSYVEVARYVKSKAPSVLIADALRTHELAGGIDAWIPFAEHFEIRPDFYYERRDNHGEELMWYYCGNPSYKPNRGIGSPLLATRLSDWLTFRLDLTGFLHWAYMIDYPDVHPDKPVDGGDSFVVYKGAGGRPEDSIRYEAILDSLEDYELLRLLEKRDKKIARDLCGYVVQSVLHFTRDIREFNAARTALLQLSSMSDSDLAEKGPAAIAGLKRLQPFQFLPAERSTARDDTPWTLVFEDNFERAEIGDDWAPRPADPDKGWSIRDGWLTVPRDRAGEAVIICRRPAPGAQRLEYDCRAEFPACDLSAMLALPGRDDCRWSEGCFFGFGGEQNAFSKCINRGRPLKWYEPTIVPGKTHRVVIERDGNTLRHYIDGRLAFEYLDSDPAPEDRERIGFYIWTNGQIDNVKLYNKNGK